MVDAVALGGPSVTPSITSPRGVSGRIAVPVRPATAVYARFRHILGVPDRHAAAQVPMLKLRVLDNLIESYVNAKASRLGVPGSAVQVTVDSRTIDTYVSALRDQLRGEAIPLSVGSSLSVRA